MSPPGVAEYREPEYWLKETSVNQRLPHFGHWIGWLAWFCASASRSAVLNFRRRDQAAPPRAGILICHSIRPIFALHKLRLVIPQLTPGSEREKVSKRDATQALKTSFDGPDDGREGGMQSDSYLIATSQTAGLARSRQVPTLAGALRPGYAGAAPYFSKK